MATGIPARIFAIILRISPGRVRNWMWKWWYQRLAKAHERADFRFMNYGYKDEEELKLSKEDEPNRLFIQLYNMNIRDVELKGKEVVEVGSGRGGGAFWIARTCGPKKLIGFDFSKEAVKLSNEWYSSQTNLSFKEGNAESLPLENNSQDIIYNVESSHCYGNAGAFVKEVYRALRTGGNFCWTDFRDKPTMEKLHDIFLDSGFQIVSKREITSEVLVALDEINESKVQGIRESVPRSMRKSFETFAGVQGTPVYEAFKAGNLHYHRYLMVKPE